MMGEPSRGQEQLFYGFNLESHIPHVYVRRKLTSQRI